jgi:hypothetical protein
MDFDANQGQRILALTWSLVWLSFAFLLARLYCKWRTKPGLWWDDYVLMLSLVMFDSECSEVLRLTAK